NNNNRNEVNGRVYLSSSSDSVSLILSLPSSIDASQTYELQITKCTMLSNGSDDGLCTLIYPSSTSITYTTTKSQEMSTWGVQNSVPDWIWYLLLVGTTAGMVGGYVLYVRLRNRHLQSEEKSQFDEDNALLPELGVEDIDTGMMNVNKFNPSNIPPSSAPHPSTLLDQLRSQKEQHPDLANAPVQNFKHKEEAAPP
ncbi:hypothetical protein RFI_28143, partial [Reticulomyxa filosa]